ncbi:HNH endonuclease [Chelatococcus sp.]|uniref:HNH endonuclease n=1 Tax=Chelatococcus sp. TaxID=1953771 RepID=UPI001EC7F64B|nr:HNH endonuclease [Chelatococcus sp.]
MAELIDRFWEKISPEPNSGCWLWTAATTKPGYGALRVDGKTRTAHRLAWELFCSELSPDDCVLHRCDNRQCANPEHLFLGDRAANVADAVNKKRNAFGERHPNAKLTEGEVHSIRSSTDTCQTLADRHGVSPATISFVRRQKRWRHLDKRS